MREVPYSYGLKFRSLFMNSSANNIRPIKIEPYLLTLLWKTWLFARIAMQFLANCFLADKTREK